MTRNEQDKSVLGVEDACSRSVADVLERNEISVPHRITLEGFNEHVDRSQGCDVGLLEPLTALSIETENSRYEIVLLQPSERRAMVQGGRLFAEPVEATIQGSTFGGNLLKLGWIGVGMRLELYLGRRFVLTSTVQSIEIRRDAPQPEPF